mgnify:CR=1 FL=1
MRFRIKSGQSARRFVFDRTPAPAKSPQPSAPRAADLDNPYGRYYSRAEGVLFSIFVFLRRCDLKYSPL